MENILAYARRHGNCDAVMAAIADDALDPDIALQTFAIIRLAHPHSLYNPIAAALWTVALLYIALRPENSRPNVHPPAWLPMLALHTPAPYALDDLASGAHYPKTWLAWRNRPGKFSEAIFLLDDSAFKSVSAKTRNVFIEMARSDPHAAKNIGYCLNVMDDHMRHVIAMDPQAALMAVYLMGHDPLWLKAASYSPESAANYALALGRERFQNMPANDKHDLEQMIFALPETIVHAAEGIGFLRPALHILERTGDRDVIAEYVVRSSMRVEDWETLDNRERHVVLEAVASSPESIRVMAPVLNSETAFWSIVITNPRRTAAAMAGLGRDSWKCLDEESRRKFIEYASSDAEAAAILSSVAGHDPVLFNAASRDPHAMARYVKSIGDAWSKLPNGMQLKAINAIAASQEALALAFSTVHGHPVAWQHASLATLIEWLRQFDRKPISAEDRVRIARRIASAPDISSSALIAVAPHLGFSPAMWRVAVSFGEEVAVRYASYAMCAESEPDMKPAMRQRVIDMLATSTLFTHQTGAMTPVFLSSRTIA